MSITMRVKFIKIKDMIYISHLDVQSLFQRAFRRAGISLSYSQGYNPHPKMSYGNALALGVESYGEYVDIDIENDISEEELMTSINAQLPEGIKFVKCLRRDGSERALASNIEYGDYEFYVDNLRDYSLECLKDKLDDFLNQEEILVTKKNKKKQLVEVDIRPMIQKLYPIDIVEGRLHIGALLATGSKQNLNTNVFLPCILAYLDIELDYLDVDIIRNDLYMYIGSSLIKPME